MFAGSGVHLPRSTLLNILTASAELIQPFIEHLRNAVRTDACLGTDDTGVCLMLPDTIPGIDSEDPKSRRVHEVIRNAMTEKKKSIRAKMWVYRGLSVPLNIFDFTIPALVVITTTLIIAFGVFGLSDFAPNRMLGVLVAFILTGALVTDLTLLPALLLKPDPRYPKKPRASGSDPL